MHHDNKLFLWGQGLYVHAYVELIEKCRIALLGQALCRMLYIQVFLHKINVICRMLL